MAGERIPVPQAKYSLLHVDTTKCTYNRYVILSVGSLVVSFLILCIFVATIGIYEQALYPKNTHKKDIPKQWINRAIMYNTISNYSINTADKIVHRKEAIINDFKLVCYYQFPAENSIKHKFPRILLPHKIEPTLCTHINVAFASVVNHSIYLDTFSLNFAKTVIDLKKDNKDLKVLLSIGGADNEKGFPEMVKDHEHRKLFIKSIDFYVRTYKFDGIDLDWEFPNMNPMNDNRQKVHFTQLLREIRNEINRQDRHKFLLSVAVAAPHFIVDLAYDVAYMNDYVDYVNLMTYDFHFYSKATPFTGLNAPLYPTNEVGYFATLNINYTAYYWHLKGMDKQKIIIGLPTYGHSYKLLNVNNNGLYAPARSYGFLGANGFVDFNDICWFLTKNQVKPFFVVESKSPYATVYNEWISYDDQTSLTFKAEFIKNNNFGGAMILSLNTDDHEGYCKTDGNSMHFPLTNRVKTVLNDQQL